MAADATDERPVDPALPAVAAAEYDDALAELIRHSTMARCSTTGKPFHGPRATLIERRPGSATFRCPSCTGEHQVDRDGTRTGYSLILGNR